MLYDALTYPGSTVAFDGVTNDRAALQAHANWCFANNSPIIYPRGRCVVQGGGIAITGVYGAGQNHGLIIQGKGAGGYQAPAKEATVFICDSMGGQGLFELGTNSFYSSVIEGIGITSAGGTGYGIHFVDQQGSACVIRDCLFENITLAIAITYTSGNSSNGEMLTVDCCSFYNIGQVYVNQSINGQAYGHSFHNCQASMSASAVVAFELGTETAGVSPGWGYGLSINNCNVSFPANVTTSTYLIYDHGSDAPVIVMGGRFERARTVYGFKSASALSSSPIKFIGCEFTEMSASVGSTNPATTLTPLVDGTLLLSGAASSGNSAQHKIVFDTCVFRGRNYVVAGNNYSPSIRFRLNSGDNTQIFMPYCTLWQIADYSQVTALPFSQRMGLSHDTAVPTSSGTPTGSSVQVYPTS